FTLFMLGTANIGATSIKGGDYYWVSGEKKYSEVVLDSWTEETKNTATYPRLTTTSGDNNFRSSDYWLYSSDRFDLSKVQLTYALPQSVIGNSFIKGLNIHLSGSNLLTISKNKDIMELNIGGSPQTRFYNLGIKAVF
ncbi:MAG: SusC/RagA family TonB-linked outer membrane protein, partial [Prolixibacteraceae bacterium]|nr:SusC/RagA family TonB-linked outer membrane protein [Prolixibacteraceae bacterium]